MKLNTRAKNKKVNGVKPSKVSMKYPKFKAKPSKSSKTTSKKAAHKTKKTSVLNSHTTANSVSARRSKRSHNPINSFHFEEEKKTKVSNNEKTKNNLPIYLKGENLAIRNESGSFYLCVALQNLYEKTASFKLQWLNCDDSSDVYNIDYVDKADVNSVLKDVQLVKKSAGKFFLSKDEKKKIETSLKNSEKAEKGLPISHDDDEDEKKVFKKKRKSSANMETLTAAVKMNVKKRKKADDDKDTTPSKKNKLKPSKPEKLKNAKFAKNLDISVLKTDPTFNSTDYLMPISIEADTKLTLKAVKLRNYKFLQKILDDVKRTAHESLNRSGNCKENSVREAVIHEDLKALKILFKYQKDSKKKKKSVSIPYHSLNASDTGTMSVKMLGHATAPISAARGSKQGNAALFVNDAEIFYYDGSELMNLALKMGGSKKLIDYIHSELGERHQESLSERIFTPLRYGRVNLVITLIEDVVKRNGFGFTSTFLEALKKEPDFTNLRSVSVTKKSNENKKITPLHCAAINPFPKALSMLLKIEPNFTIADTDLNQVIHYAAANISSKCMEYLVERNISTDVYNKKGQSPLYIACKLGRTDTVDLLLKKATEFKNELEEDEDDDTKKKKKTFLRETNLLSKKGLSPLHVAAKRGHHATVKCILKYDVNIERKTSARKECVTALMLAAEQGHLAVVQTLVEGGARLEIKDRRGKTALIHAVLNGQTHVASYLLHEGADPKIADSSGNTLVHYAAAYGWFFCLKLVIDAGADPTLSNTWKLPPIAAAMLKNHEGIVRYLLDLPEIDINFKDQTGKTLLMHSVALNFSDDVTKQIKHFIIKKNCSADLTDMDNNNCLHYLASNSHIHRLSKKERTKFCENITEIGKLLIEKGCRVDVFNKSGFTPLHVAIHTKFFPLIELLLDTPALDKIAKIPVVPDSTNFLHFLLSNYCSTEQYYYIFEKIVEKLFKINPQGNFDNKALIEKMNNVKNEKGNTPLLVLCYQLLKEMQIDKKELVNEDGFHHEFDRFEVNEVAYSDMLEDNYDDDEGHKETSNDNDSENDDSEDIMSDQDDENGNDKSDTDVETGMSHAIAKIVSNDLNNISVSDDLNDSQSNLDDDYDGDYGGDGGDDGDDGDGDEDDDDDDGDDGDEDEAWWNTEIKEHIFPAVMEVIIKKLKCDPCTIQTHPTPKYNTLNSPLHILAMCDFKSFEIFAEAGANFNLFNKIGIAPIHCALKECNVDVLSALAKNGADVNLWTKFLTKQNLSPLLSAIVVEDANMIKILVENNADVNHAIPSSKWTVLHSLATDSLKSDALLHLTRMVLSAGANPNMTNDKGMTPLHISVSHYRPGTDSRTEFEELLIEYKANTNVKDNYGKLALHYAFVNVQEEIKIGDPIEMVAMLLGHMDRQLINVQDISGRNCLHHAAASGGTVCSLLFSDKVKSIELKNNEGNTALGLALMNAHESCSLSLLQKNADFNGYLVKSQGQSKSNEEKSALLHPYIDFKPPNEVMKEPMLREVIRLNWQGVLYMVLNTLEKQSGNFSDAIEAAIKENQLNLALKLIRRTRKVESLHKRNKNGQNFLHLLAIYTKSVKNNATKDNLSRKVAKMLQSKGLSLLNKDNYNATPLIYAVQNRNVALCKLFGDELKLNEPNCLYFDTPDKFGRTITSAMFWSLPLQEPSNSFKLWMKGFVKAGGNLNVLTRYPSSASVLDINCPGLKCLTDMIQYMDDDKIMKIPKISPLIFATISRSQKLLSIFLSFGPDLNFPCDAGMTPIMYSIIMNDINSLKLLLNRKHAEELIEINKLSSKEKEKRKVLSIEKIVHDRLKTKAYVHCKLAPEDFYFVKKSNVDLQRKDKIGRTVVHHLIQHYPHGAFDNLRMLQFLIAVGFSVPNVEWLKYLDLADSSGAVNIARFLRTFLGVSSEKAHVSNFSVQDPVGNLISNKYSYEDDAKKAIEAIDPSYFVPDTTIKPHPNCSCASVGNVLLDEDQDIHYSVKMQKFDFNYGNLGYYNFYIMQVVHNEAQDVYILFTHWGRIGEEGQYQNTPFPSKDDAIKEFCKIFNSKSGNEWTEIKNFQPVNKKYRLVKTAKKKEVSIKNMDICLNSDKSPASKLPPTLRKFLELISDIEMLQNGWRLHIDSNVSPFGMLNVEEILEGKQYVMELDNILKQKDETDDGSKKSELIDEAEKLSEKVFYLLPLLEYGCQKEEILKPITTRYDCRKNIELIEELMDYDVCSKLVLGACHNIREIHPMDYIYTSARLKLELMNPKDKMTMNIIQHIRDSSTSTIHDIYKVEIPGADEKLSKLNIGNHKLLWHGTKLENVLSILTKGLTVSPTTASFTGNAFGEGIYFSDVFSFSEDYCTGKDYRVIFLCEVALGRVNANANYGEAEKNQSFDSLKSGYRVPKRNYDFSFTSPYGCAMSLGSDSGSQYCNTEYIISNKNQACIRYMVVYKA